MYNLIFPGQCTCCGAHMAMSRHSYGCRRCYRLLAEEYESIGLHNRDIKKSILTSHLAGHLFLFCNIGLHKQLFKRAKLTPSYRALRMLLSLSTQKYLKDIDASFHDLEAIIPIPSHFESLLKRGFAPAAEFGNALSTCLSLKIDHHSLRFNRRTKKQARLNRAERLTNITRSFISCASKVKGKNILLVDDIVTTGATILEAKRTLLSQGAAKVQTLSLAVSPLIMR